MSNYFPESEGLSYLGVRMLFVFFLEYLNSTFAIISLLNGWKIACDGRQDSVFKASGEFSFVLPNVLSTTQTRDEGYRIIEQGSKGP